MSFTEIKAEELKDNPFDLIGKQWMLITAGNEEKCNTMTASWGGVGIMWGKNIATAYIRPQRYTKKFMDETGMYTLSFLSEDYRKALNLCCSKSGRDCDKDKEAGQCYEVGMFNGWNAVNAPHYKFYKRMVDSFPISLSNQHCLYILIEVL